MAISVRTNVIFTLSVLILCGTYYFASASQRDSSSSKDNNPGAYGSNKQNALDLDAFKVGPYFDKAASKNVTALLGKTAYLNCRVKNLGNKTSLLQVSWVRHRDIHLLTVGRYTYTSDQRFRAIHHPHSEDWILQVKYPQHRDSGIYECQVSTTPHMSHYIHLNVIEPSTVIIGASDMYIESGSTINLTCVIEDSPEPPAYIFWNHNNAIVTYDSPRGGIRVTTRKDEASTSFLLIENAQPSDSGVYQCNPSNAKSKSVTVHVLNGVSHSVSRENPNSNAVRGSSSSSARNKLSSLSFYLLITIFINIIFIQCSFWFKLFEWRRYVGDMIDFIVVKLESIRQMEGEEEPPQQQQPSVLLTTIILDRFFTMQYFWFRIQYLFQWSTVFISLKYSMQLFIQIIYLNCTSFAYAVASVLPDGATAVVTMTTPQPIKPNAFAFNGDTELFIKTDANNIDHVMNLDHALFCRDAANQQTIIQTKQTDQL
ncbi:uncharacterized protein LOC116342762 isoform X1 [Contarinia nasturtii]|uniref:uncharacterized protein LOC116342762 isoform X1 n=1 Tax=Contarinia nasturtii TaxID=265458 RepID=UPI0012D3C77C|nr:uncharacterized protein LOC116342762 isoform X1 [Contarinia nasturtii]